MNNIENSETDFVNPQKKKFWKLVVVFSLIAIGFIAIIVRLVFLQIIDSDKYRQIAKTQHESLVKLKAERGDILDRNGKLLATTVKSYSFAIDPSILKDKRTILGICKLVSEVDESIDSDLLYSRVISADGSFIWLIRGLLPEQASVFDSVKVRGFIKIAEPKRSYLYGTFGSQIIGCTDIDNNGLTGIELSCDSLLKGVEGQVLMLRDAAGRLIPTPSITSPDIQKGKSVKLTIDIELQRIVEHELKLGVMKANSESGTVIVIKPATGEILAMASYPTFDPNNIQNLIQGTTRNRAINDLYEPGSTFKLITAAAALEEDIVNPESVLNGHNGYIEYEDYFISDEHKLGKVSFKKALVLSSNIIFSDIAYRIKPDIWYKYVRDFGFGLLHGVELSGESRGKIKTPKQLDPVSRRFNGFGYGLSVTSLQMVNAYAAIANNGEMMKPYVIREYLNSYNGSIEKTRPIKIRRIVSAETSQKLTDMLVSVVNEGTGKEATIAGLRIAGKTGTAQIVKDSIYSKQDYTASFAGYFPADNPELAMLIVIDKPQGNIYGGSTAAPVFRNIAKSWMAVSNSLTEDDSDKQGMDFSVKFPDLRGLDVKSASIILKSLGIEYTGDKRNFIISVQYPKPGTTFSLDKQEEIVIKFNKNEQKLKGLNPNLTGLDINTAMSFLRENGIIPVVHGTGIVKNYEYLKDRQGKRICRLYCN